MRTSRGWVGHLLVGSIGPPRWWSLTRMLWQRARSSRRASRQLPARNSLRLDLASRRYYFPDRACAIRALPGSAVRRGCVVGRTGASLARVEGGDSLEGPAAAVSSISPARVSRQAHQRRGDGDRTRDAGLHVVDRTRDADRRVGVSNQWIRAAARPRYWRNPRKRYEASVLDPRA